MQPLFLGGHPAIDFLNTSFWPDGEPVETLGDGRALLAWMVRAELLTQEEADSLARRVGARALDATAAEARKLRDWARTWLRHWRNGEKRWRLELYGLNAWLSRAPVQREVVAEGDIAIIERPHVDSGDALLAMLAHQIALLITKEKGTLVKSCTGGGCTLWFLDRTKTHKRVFCSAAVCGNRAKVAAFRKRQRARA